MGRAHFHILLIGAIALFGGTANAQKFSDPDPNEPDHIRGKIAKLENGSMVVDTIEGESLTMAVPDTITVIRLSKARWQIVDFGTYVGSVGVRLDRYSPIIRDSLSWLHEGSELRIVDEPLRGIAAGHKIWDLFPESIIAHGWVDDIEDRVLSIKYGPTEEEETDMEIGRDKIITFMALGDKSMIAEDKVVFAGAQDINGQYTAVFVIVGEDGIEPPL